MYSLPEMPLSYTSRQGDQYSIRGYGWKTAPYTSPYFGDGELIQHISIYFPTLKGDEVYVDTGLLLIKLFRDSEGCLRVEPTKIKQINANSNQDAIATLMLLDDLLGTHLDQDSTRLSAHAQEMIRFTCLAEVLPRESYYRYYMIENAVLAAESIVDIKGEFALDFKHLVKRVTGKKYLTKYSQSAIRQIQSHTRIPTLHQYLKAKLLQLIELVTA